MDYQTKLTEILDDLKIDLYHGCCLNPDCDGYHPGEDESDKKALTQAQAAITALNAESFDKIKINFLDTPLWIVTEDSFHQKFGIHKEGTKE